MWSKISLVSAFCAFVAGHANALDFAEVDDLAVFPSVGELGKMTVRVSGPCKLTYTVNNVGLVRFTYLGQSHQALADVTAGKIYFVLQSNNTSYTSIKSAKDMSYAKTFSVFNWDPLNHKTLLSLSGCLTDLQGISTLPKVNLIQEWESAEGGANVKLTIKSKLITYQGDFAFVELGKWLQTKFDKVTVSIRTELILFYPD